jgi:hypothetical protein
MDKDVEKHADVLDSAPAHPEQSDTTNVPISDEKQPQDGTESSPPQPVNPMDPSAYPEGGLKAWTVVFGAACGLVVSFGWINCEEQTFDPLHEFVF